MDEEMLGKMRKYHQMLIWARIDSDGKEQVQLYHNNNIDVTIIMEAEYDI